VIGIAGAIGLLALARPGVAQPPAPAFGGPAGEVQLEVEQFGMGNTVRPGDWAGVRVRVTDSAPKQREVVIQMTVTDADSDRALIQREITTNPGVPQGTWLYARLPAGFRTGEALNISAYEAVEVAGEGLRPGRLLGTNRLVSKRVVEPTTSLMAVIGPKTFGLNRYSDRPGSQSPYPPFGHELVEIVSGMAPGESMPDRWIGYEPFGVLVWGGGNPSELRAERAAALKEWVRRGGHLVIVLPAVGENWTNPQASELHELLPAVSVSRREGVDLSAYRALITFEPRANLPRDGVVYRFTRPEGVPENEAMIILTGPDGDGVVSRRLYGAGMVTLVGLDLNNRLLAEFEGLEPVVFWNRLLGRRGPLPTQPQLTEYFKGEVPSRSGDVDFDLEIVGLISQPGDAATGILLGLVLFIGYWLVAGPLGFALLKRRGFVRHSWLAFAAAGAVFTAIAWGGATLIRPRQVAADHVTLIDHVFGQPVDRARSWLSVLIPWYGDATVAVGEENAKANSERPEFINLIAAWDPPSATGPVGSFPDARGYVVDARNPSSLTIPVRSTVKQVQADWAGGPVWKMPFPVAGPDGAPTKLTAVENTPPIGGSWATGSLTHDLPGALTDFTIIVVPRLVPLRASGAKFTGMYANAQAFSGDEWLPGDPLDLAQVTRRITGMDPNAAAQFKRLRDRWAATDNIQQTMAPNQRPVSANDAERLLGVAFFTQLEPPGFDEGGRLGGGAAVARRRLTHGWDLGRWFGQPCIIIVGRVGDDKKPGPCPIPLTVDGRKLPTTGTTIVRWIYPLPDNPPDPTPRPESSTEPGAAERTGGGV